MTTTSAIAYHDGMAFGWDERYASGSFRRRARFIESRIMPSLFAGGTWLDAGCGSGYFSRLLASGGRKVVGVDASQKMLDAAELARAWSGRNDDLRFEHVACVSALPYGTGQFDGILCLSVVEYADRPHAVLDELVRVLAPGGRLVYSVPRRDSVLRALQGVRNRLDVTRGAAGSAYMRTSRHAMREVDIHEHAAGSGLATPDILAFDPYLPAAVHPLLPPSLLFASLLKRGAER